MQSLNKTEYLILSKESQSFTFPGMNSKQNANNDQLKEDDSFKLSGTLVDNEDSLGYKSTYIPNYDQKEEKETSSNETEKTAETKENDCDNKIKDPLQSIQFISPYKEENNCISILQYRNEYRKMSSPICSYFHSSYKALSEMFEKSCLSIIDYSKSNNFINKDSLKNNNNNKANFNNNINYQTYYDYAFPDSNSYQNESEYENLYNKDDMIRIRASSFSGIKDFSNLTLGTMGTFIPRGLKIAGFPMFFPNKINYNKGVKGSGRNKVLTEREGDWICFKCKNLNFAFRILCNRCKLAKEESENMAESGKMISKGNSTNSTNSDNNGNVVEK